MEPLRLPPIRDLRLNHDDDYAGAPPRDQRLAKVVDNCKELCRFADHYGMPLDARPRTCLTLFPATNHPHKPAEGEIAVMVQYAEEVIAMLRDYRRVACPPSPSPAPVPTIPAAASPARPPKRPWEDAEHVPQRIASSSPAERPSPDSSSSPPRVAPAQEAHMHVFDGVPERVVPMDDDARAVAARDMEDIRARRAAGQGAGQGKIKYKKRSVTSPAPGKVPLVRDRRHPRMAPRPGRTAHPLQRLRPSYVLVPLPTHPFLTLRPPLQIMPSSCASATALSAHSRSAVPTHPPSTLTFFASRPEQPPRTRPLLAPSAVVAPPRTRTGPRAPNAPPTRSSSVTARAPAGDGAAARSMPTSLCARLSRVPLPAHKCRPILPSSPRLT
ncbi:GATA type zinc finger [Ceratobasidium sp. AG-Ba]|nr:GATA type zinc finger [Ceratobasidium sp. AG-Ba]